MMLALSSEKSGGRFPSPRIQSAFRMLLAGASLIPSELFSSVVVRFIVVQLNRRSGSAVGSGGSPGSCPMIAVSWRWSTTFGAVVIAVVVVVVGAGGGGGGGMDVGSVVGVGGAAIMDGTTHGRSDVTSAKPGPDAGLGVLPS